jgi:hypothetical protein
VVLSVVLGAAVAATAAPLLTYSVTLAVFGGAHVLGELRFVDARFSARLDQRLVWGLTVFLGGVVLLRLAKNLGWWGGAPATQVELMLVAGLGALVLPRLALQGVSALATGVVVVGSVGAGLLFAPVWTMLALACLHNWTPVGFLADGLPRAERKRGLWMGLFAFAAVPLIIASGAPGAMLATVGAHGPDLTVLPTGSLSQHFSAYLHRSLHHTSWAVPVFSALVFAQCMHYATVLGVLPRIAPGGRGSPSTTGLSRIPTGLFVLGVVCLTAAGLVGFLVDFPIARRWYGVVAAIHAWVEVPLLLLALAPSGAAPLEDP